MLHNKRDFFISRINAGYHRFNIHDIILNVFPPSVDIEYEACEIFNEVYEEAYYDGILTVEESYEVLMDKGLWTSKDERDLENAPENIEILKMELYRAAFKSNTRRKIRERLDITRNEYERLLGLKNSLSQYTCTGLANYAKWNYILEHSTYLPDGSRYDWKDLSVHHVMAEYNSSMLTSEAIRELARNDPWSGIWAMKKKNGHIFKEPWSVEQKIIVNWSMLYDSIYESAEAPSSDIIEDDDMLDGWLIIKRRERENEQAKKQGDEAISQNKKIANAGEIFIPAETVEDAKRIQNMNDAYGRRTYKQRLAQVDKEGTVKHGHLKDVVQDVKMKAQQEYVNKVRNK